MTTPAGAAVSVVANRAARCAFLAASASSANRLASCCSAVNKALAGGASNRSARFFNFSISSGVNADVAGDESLPFFATFDGGSLVLVAGRPNRSARERFLSASPIGASVEEAEAEAEGEATNGIPKRAARAAAAAASSVDDLSETLPLVLTEAGAAGAGAAAAESVDEAAPEAAVDDADADAESAGVATAVLLLADASLVAALVDVSDALLAKNCSNRSMRTGFVPSLDRPRDSHSDLRSATWNGLNNDRIENGNHDDGRMVRLGLVERVREKGRTERRRWRRTNRVQRRRRNANKRRHE